MGKQTRNRKQGKSSIHSLQSLNWKVPRVELNIQGSESGWVQGSHPSLSGGSHKSSGSRSFYNKKSTQMVTQIYFSSHWTTTTTSSVVQYKGQGNACQQTHQPPPHWNSIIFPKSSPEGCKQEKIVVQIEVRTYKSSSQETVQENSMPCFRSLPFLHMYKKDLINPLKVIFRNCELWWLTSLLQPFHGRFP
jgi:hypothetical protein